MSESEEQENEQEEEPLKLSSPPIETVPPFDVKISGETPSGRYPPSGLEEEEEKKQEIKSDSGGPAEPSSSFLPKHK